MAAATQPSAQLNYVRTPFANEGVSFAILEALELSERLNTLPFLSREVGAEGSGPNRKHARTRMPRTRMKRTSTHSRARKHPPSTHAHPLSFPSA